VREAEKGKCKRSRNGGGEAWKLPDMACENQRRDLCICRSWKTHHESEPMEDFPLILRMHGDDAKAIRRARHRSNLVDLAEEII
jgi:hypothetical protein